MISAVFIQMQERVIHSLIYSNNAHKIFSKNVLKGKFQFLMGANFAPSVLDSQLYSQV